MMHLIKKFPLLSALFISLVLCGAVSLALYLNEDWRQTTFALIVEEVDEDGEVVKKVKVEKPEPNRDQVREIARNQELKKREKLEENAKKLRKAVVELEEVVEVRKSSIQSPDAWDELAIRIGSLLEKTEQLRYRQTKSRYLSKQPNLPQQLKKLRNLTKKNCDQMRMLALQVEVDESDAWEALNQAREMVDAITPTKDIIRTAYQSAAAIPADQDGDKLVSFMMDRVNQLKEIIVEADAYLSDFEKLLIVDNSTIQPDVEPLQSPNEVKQETADSAEPEEVNVAAKVPTEQALEEMNTAELYESIQDMTEQLDAAFAENKALELAEFKQISLDDAKEQVYAPTTDKGPELAEQLAKNQPNTSEEFKELNQALDKAVSSSERIARQAENRLEAVVGSESADLDAAQTADKLQESLKKDATIKAKMAIAGSNMGRSNGNLQDLRSLMDESYERAKNDETGFGVGADGLSHLYDSETFVELDSLTDNPKGVRLNWNTAIANALPSRRFDMDSSRKGWIFIDTWYMIGPWQIPKGREFEVPFPPETMIDLDATYTGKVHPKTKKPIELQWHFMQSGSLRMSPPDELSSSVYYAYTEVFCASAMDVVVAVASDDRSKLWINDLVVFEDVGLSPWRLDEGFRRVLLKPGYNKVLLRLENGPGGAIFSVLMCPAEALTAIK
jgi:hypothetical protein